MGTRSTKIIRTFTSDWGESLEEVACPTCAASDATLLLESRDPLYGQPGRYRLVRCNACALVYVNPRPTPDALGIHYPDDYLCYQAPEDGPALFRKMSEASARDWSRKRLARLERVVGRLQPAAAIADVGCGLNDLLHMIKLERGVIGTGIDIKERMVKRIRERLGMPAVQGSLSDARFEDGQLDLLMMIEYLEHEPDPAGLLAESRRVLKSGGHLAVEIPHFTGAPAKLFKSRWSNLDLPRHLVLFEPETLRRTFADHGFELVSYQPFTMPLHFGISLVFMLGGFGLGRNPFAPWFAAALGCPFVPFMRWLPEFAFAVGRAV